MLTKVFGSAVSGVEATTIAVEVNTDIGVGYHLVGLPDNAIRESNYRIAAALQNNGYSVFFVTEEGQIKAFQSSSSLFLCQQLHIILDFKWNEL